MGIKTTIGINCRRIRERAQLSQEAVAEISGLHRSYLGGIERGEHTMGVVNLERIARAMNVLPADLLVDPDKPLEPLPEKPAPTGDVFIHWPTFWTMLKQCSQHPEAIKNYLTRSGIEVQL